jgi:hypothetical protein
MIAFIDTSLHLMSIITSHILTSFLNDVCLTHLSEEFFAVVWISDWSLLLLEFTNPLPLYNCHAVGIEVTMWNSSSVFTGMTLFSDWLPSNHPFTAIIRNGNIRCLGNITQPLPSNGRLLQLHNSGLQPSCHSVLKKKFSTHNLFCCPNIKHN